MLRPATALALAAAAVPFALAACSDAPAPDAAQAPVAAKTAAIQDGVVDTTDTHFVGIGIIAGGGIAFCSGSLIAPNVVLTARHCVAQIPSGYVQCGVSKFGAAYAPGSFYVTTQSTISYNSKFHRVSEVRTAPGGSDVCGYDVALLMLSDVVPDSEATPVTPRVDTPANRGETYDAVGFGATCQDDPSSTNPTCGNTAGTRRRHDGLKVTCVGALCKDPSISKDELLGDKDACEGDSGGPAIDANGQVIGVLSRGGWSPPNICDTPIYSSVASWKDFLVQAALDGAMSGGYAPPAWAAPDAGTTDDGGTASLGGACETSADCPSPQVCVSGSPNYCTVTCADSSACPDGWSCEAISGASVCSQVPASSGDGATADPNTKSSKCSVAPGRVGADPTKPTPWLALALALALPALRRRRRG